MFWACGALFRADAKKRHSASWGRELRAGEGLRLAGFSSGRRACARGDCPARRCGSVATFCLRFTPVMRFSRNVLRSVHACCLTLSAKQDGLRYLAFLFRAGRDRHSCVLAVLARLSAFVGSLRNCAFICGDLDGVTGDAGLRSWRRGLCASLRNHISIAMLSAGSTLGLRAPNLRQRVFDSLDSLHAAAGLCWCVYAPSPGHTERPARL